MKHPHNQPLQAWAKRSAAQDRRDAGYALVLVLIAVAIAAVVAMSVLSGSAPTAAMARNATYLAQARVIAEAGVDAIEAYVHDNSINWHTHQSQKTEGWWFNNTEQPLGGGSFKIWAERVDGNGGIDTEDFQATDRIRVVSVGRFDGRSAQVTRIITPEAQTSQSLRVLLVLDRQNSPTPGSQDSTRASLMNGWGFQVGYLSSNASQPTYDSSIASHDVVYISENVDSTDVGTKLNACAKGVVNEEGLLVDDLGYSLSRSDMNNTSTIDLISNAHSITTGMTLGVLQITTSGTELVRASGTMSTGAKILAKSTGGGQTGPTLGVMHLGDPMVAGGTCAGRRVFLPWGGNSFDINLLNDTGKEIMRRAIVWAAETGDLLAQWELDETGGTTAADSANGFSGTIYNGVSLNQPGKVGTAFYFDGSNDHVEIAHNNAMLLDQGTVSMWVYPTRTSVQEAMFSKDSMNYDTGGHLHLYSNNGRPTARFQSTTSEVSLNASSNWAINTWHHYVFSFGPAGAKLYINGTLVDSESYTGGMGTTSGGAGNYEPLVLGAGTWSSGDLTKNTLNQYFCGRLDRVRWYRVQLSDSEIADLYTTP